jgi:L-fuconolactonase
MDIVDGQVHVGRGEIDATLAAMDALGIRSMLIDEFWGTWGGSHPAHIDPGYLLPNGAWRAAWPTAEEASILHPDRFSYIVRIDPRDPQLEAVMRLAGSSPHARAFRVQPVWTLEEAAGFAQGSYDELFALAEDIGKPVCLFVPGYVELLPRYLQRYPRLTFVIDHCGMGFPNIPAGRPPEEAARSQDPAYFTKVQELAGQANVALKWGHAQARFGATSYPYEPLRPLLRSAIEAFGAQRIFWASDHSVQPQFSWSDLLHGLRDDPEFDLTEKTWLLGQSAREVFDWPAAASPEEVQ